MIEIFLLTVLALGLTLPLMFFKKTRRFGRRVAFVTIVLLILIVVFQAGYIAGQVEQTMQSGAESVFGQ